MPLQAGARLGAYEILSPLGAGGMGEVYRARDSRLGREVAIKVLPESVARDAERLARFEREARALAALNHPGIVTIFSVEDSGGMRFLAMELVDGESLDTIIAAGALPLSRFFDIAAPLAEALSAAHERGIVHRDLKPGNVMVTPEGRVKVLDFGLARVEGPASDPNLTNTPTQSRADLTGEGQVFGTVAYMSPEQARGGRVDARSDVFSLGIVLYETLTGERPFRGESAVDLITSILRDRPPSLSDRRADAPPHLSRIVRRCLEKDPRDRYQTSRDVYNELKELRAEASSPPARSGRPPSTPPRAEDGFWVAVLPFKHRGADPGLEALAEGLAEEVVNGLSRFSYLRVVTRSASSQYGGDSIDARQIGQALGAAYVLEGSLRQAGSVLRVGVQLVDAATGAHIWSETFDRDVTGLDAFQAQDQIADRIVATVADPYGVLARSMAASTRSKPLEDLPPYETVLRFFLYQQRVSAEDHRETRAALERAVGVAPGSADAWAALAVVRLDEYRHDFDPRPGSLDRALEAANRAVDADPTNPLASCSLAQVHFYRRETGAFRAAAERAIALNRRDGNTLADLGLRFADAGDWGRGLELTRAAMALNPHHPGWYRFGEYLDHYRRGEYTEALAVAEKINMPGYYVDPLSLAASHAQLGHGDAARAALRDLLQLQPHFARRGEAVLEKRLYAQPELVAHLMDGLRKAGLEPGEPRAADPAPETSRPPAPVSGAARADEGFWVAVLPFQHGGADASVAALAEGMIDEIVTGLSRFSYLRVISRTSTRRYASGDADVRTVGRELGARYVLDGSLRQAGPALRVSVQLTDAASGANLWAETYNRSYQPEAIFDVQDDVVRRIVSTVADTYGVLPHSMSQALRDRNPEELTPYEAVIRGLAQLISVSADEHAAVRASLERAVQQAPGNADCWAILSNLYREEYAHGFNPQPDSIGRALAAARRAVEIAPSNHLAYHALATALFLRRELSAFRSAADRAIALNPMDGFTMAFLGSLVAYSGDWKRGCAMAKQARDMNPHHPGWYWFTDCFDAYRQGDDRTALEIARRIQMPGFWRANLALAAAHGQLGERDAAARALQQLLTLRPGFAAEARAELQKWWDPELIDRLMDGLHKAGLEAPAAASSSPSSPASSVSIAVLPFSDMSPAKDQEYLCEGMAEEIMHALVRIEGIRVASRMSAFRARRDGGDLPSVARALSVGHVLEGSVRTSGSRLRVTAQLTEASSGYQLWSERFDREAADVFAVQDEIAAGVVDAVKTRLAPGVHAVTVRPQARNLEAYRRYLEGRHLRGIEDHAGALRAFEEAVRLDPSLAPAWTGLAEITVLSAHFSILPAREACASARQALATAEKLQGESAEGRHVEAFAAYIERRWDVMDAAWRRALELEPRHVLALGSYGITLCARGKPDEGLALFERARKADPLASFPYTLTSWGLLLVGKPQEALRYAEEALGFEKDDASALVAESMASVALGRFEKGIAAAEQGVAISHRGPAFVGGLGWALATAGRIGEARALLTELRARPASSPTTVSEAWLLGALGNVDEAFAVIARAEEECQGQLYYTGMPAFDPLRSDPRFAALERRLGLLAG